MKRVSPEFALVTACCRWPPSAERDQALKGGVAGLDWALFHRIAVRHRVEALVWHALRRAGIEPPGEIAEAFASASIRIARQNLQCVAESVLLKHLFEQAGIPLLFVKGVSLAALAYDTIALKSGWDIDILIPLESVAEAAVLLEEAGYFLTIPEGPPDPARIRFWHTHSKESVWRNSTRETYVELHTSLTDNSMLLPDLGAHSPRQEVEVAKGKVLPTLAGDELFAYLCVHGASSGWFRLKWIADLAALLSGNGPAENERLYRRSQELGAGHAAGLALLLSAHLFDTRLGSDLNLELRSSRANRWLFFAAMRKLAGRSAAVELDRTRLGTASIHLMQLGLLSGWRYKIGDLRRRLASPLDRLAVPLPRPLHFLYPVLFVLRRSRRKGSRSPNPVPAKIK